MLFPSCTHSLLQLSEQHQDIYWCQQTNSPVSTGDCIFRAPFDIQPSPSDGVAPASGPQGLPVAHTPEQSKAKRTLWQAVATRASGVHMSRESIADLEGSSLAQLAEHPNELESDFTQ